MVEDFHVNIREIDRYPKNEFGKRVRTLRESKGLTQREFGEAIGIAHTYVSRLENSNRRVSGNVYDRIAASNLPDTEKRFLLRASGWTDPSLDTYTNEELLHPIFMFNKPTDYGREIEIYVGDTHAIAGIGFPEEFQEPDRFLASEAVKTMIASRIIDSKKEYIASRQNRLSNQEVQVFENDILSKRVP